MREHDWPGNVRELENMVRRVAALYSEDVVTPEIIRIELNETPRSAPAASGPSSESLSDSLTFHLNNYFSGHGQALPPNGLYDRVLREVERPLIELSLEATRGNQVRAAELLGINRNTLRKKIRELGIDVLRAALALEARTTLFVARQTHRLCG